MIVLAFLVIWDDGDRYIPLYLYQQTTILEKSLFGNGAIQVTRTYHRRIVISSGQDVAVEEQRKEMVRAQHVQRCEARVTLRPRHGMYTTIVLVS